MPFEASMEELKFLTFRNYEVHHHDVKIISDNLNIENQGITRVWKHQ